MTAARDMIRSKSEPTRQAPLSGVKVLELSTILMGPSAAQALGDLGADVVKVESPEGDPLRRVGASRRPGMGTCFMQANRNKRSLVLDLRQPAGRTALLKAVRQADVLLTNMRSKALQHLGITYEAVSKANPSIIHVELQGYGRGGRYEGRPAYDDMIQGAAGIVSLNAQVGDGSHRYVPLAMIDRTVGLHAVNAILAALLFRERTGKGQSIELPMFEATVQSVLGDHMGGETFVPAAGPMGYSRLLSPNRKAYRTRDGHICVLIYTDRNWKDFFTLVGRPEQWERDQRLADIATRTRHIDALYAEIADIFVARSSQDWLDLLAQADIPAAPLNTLDSLLQDPHLRDVDFFQVLEHPTEGAIRTMKPLGTWSVSPPSVRYPAPALGQHSADVLGELGYSDAEIESLAAAQVTRLPT